MNGLAYSPWIKRGAWIGFAGYVCSGPLGFILLEFIHPQPDWVSVGVFIENYHPVQMLPFLLGFLIVAGMLMLAVGHYTASMTMTGRSDPSLLTGLILSSIFTTLISFNYICQVGFVHNLVRHFSPENTGLIAGFTMANPTSFCWMNEMWGYAILGLATWSMASYYKSKNSLIRYLMIGNGWISLISPVWSIINPFWVFTPIGIGLFLFWNIWMIVMMVSIIAFTEKQIQEPAFEAPHIIS